MKHRIVLLLSIALVATGCYKTFDFDNDNRADLIVVDGNGAGWFRLGTGDPTLIWTGVGGFPAAGDYDGNGTFEPAEATAASYVTSGAAGTIAHPVSCVRNASAGQMIDQVPRDYDGDHKTDPATYCESDGTFSINGQAPVAFGSPGTGHLDPDYPVPADYDGDGRADLATFNPRRGVWHIRSSRTGADTTTTFDAATGSFPAPGDYDGDHKADIAYYGWGDHAIHVYGVATPIPLPASLHVAYPAVADYDGDGQDDASSFELPPSGTATGQWHIRSSSTGTETTYPVVASSPADYRVPAEMQFDLVVHTSFWTTIIACRTTPTGPNC